MAHCISLNDICDGLQNFKGNLNDIRNATAPHRNTLSHANRTRDIALIKKLFWKTVEYYQQTLQIRTFVGFSRNAIEWQVWSALLTYLLMRIRAFLSEWKRDFKHFFTLMKGALWAKRTVRVIVSRYGTASSPVAPSYGHSS